MVRRKRSRLVSNPWPWGLKSDKTSRHYKTLLGGPASNQAEHSSHPHYRSIDIDSTYLLIRRRLKSCLGSLHRALTGLTVTPNQPPLELRPHPPPLVTCGPSSSTNTDTLFIPSDLPPPRQAKRSKQTQSSTSADSPSIALRQCQRSSARTGHPTRHQATT